jgi:hypothetical protein
MFLAALFLATRLFAITPPTDQRDTLQCWAVSATARLDAVASRTVGHDLKLSPKYIVYMKTRAEVVRQILAGRFEHYEQGGIFPDAVEAAKQYGVMPEEAYSGFPREDAGLFRELNELIASYAGKKRPSKARVTGQVEKILAKHLAGKPPTTFAFEGESYTPESFFTTVMPGWDKARARELIYDRDAPRIPVRGRVTAFNGARYQTLRTSDRARLLAALRRSLERGEPTLLLYAVVDRERTEGDGIIGFEAHGARPRRPDKDAMEHYVLALEGRFDKRRRCAEILVKNSWDRRPGPNRGFHRIQRDYVPLITGVELVD